MRSAESQAENWTNWSAGNLPDEGKSDSCLIWKPSWAAEISKSLGLTYISTALPLRLPRLHTRHCQTRCYSSSSMFAFTTPPSRARARMWSSMRRRTMMGCMYMG